MSITISFSFSSIPIQTQCDFMENKDISKWPQTFERYVTW